MQTEGKNISGTCHARYVLYCRTAKHSHEIPTTLLIEEEFKIIVDKTIVHGVLPVYYTVLNFFNYASTNHLVVSIWKQV